MPHPWSCFHNLFAELDRICHLILIRGIILREQYFHIVSEFHRHACNRVRVSVKGSDFFLKRRLNFFYHSIDLVLALFHILRDQKTTVFLNVHRSVLPYDTYSIWGGWVRWEPTITLRTLLFFTFFFDSFSLLLNSISFSLLLIPHLSYRSYWQQRSYLYRPDLLSLYLHLTFLNRVLTSIEFSIRTQRNTVTVIAATP